MITQGAFNQLFAPGLRESFLDEIYDEYESPFISHVRKRTEVSEVVIGKAYKTLSDIALYPGKIFMIDDVEESMAMIPKRSTYEIDQEYRKQSLMNALSQGQSLPQNVYNDYGIQYALANQLGGQGFGGSLQQQQYDPYAYVRAQQEAETRRIELEGQLYNSLGLQANVLNQKPPQVRKTTNLDWIDQKVNKRRIKLS